MRIIIDAQLLQTPAWHRGMGKYSYELIKAISETSDIELVAVINSNLHTDKDVYTQIKDLFNGKIIELDLETAQKGHEGYKKTATNNKKRIESFLKSYTETFHSFLILSPFSDELAPVFPDGDFKKSVIVYDLIPFLFHEKYANRIDFQNYLARFDLLFKADRIYSISNTVKHDLEEFLGISIDKITNINGSFISHSKSKKSNNIKKPAMVNPGEKFILMPTGDELRKNNLNAVRAFEIFRKLADESIKLVTTSFYSEATKTQLNLVSDNLIFTGNISGDELSWLYKNAEMLLFPSEYEGLGLPVLEAVQEGMVVACSDIGVFKEMSNAAFHYFNPKDINSMVESIYKAYNQNRLLPEQELEYKRILKTYTWQESASRFVKAMTSTSQLKVQKRQTIAVVCPQADGYSAISKVIAEMHYELNKIYNIDYYYDKGPYHRFLRPDFLSHVSNVRTIDKFDSKKDNYDKIIYHIGNSEYHLNTFVHAMLKPGYVVLHDTNLSGLYSNLLQYGMINKSRVKAEELLDEMLNNTKSKMLTSLVSRQKGFVVHSDYALGAVTGIQDKLSLKMSAVKANLSVSGLRRDVLKSPAKVSIGLAGILADIKGLEVLEKISNSPEFSNCEFHLFGLATDELNKRLPNMPNVYFTKNPTDYEFQELLKRLDILINYRDKYNGETSLTVVEAMAKGIVVFVNNVGWYSELPQNAVIKANTKEEVYQKLRELLSDTEKLKQYKINANRYIIEYHTRANYVSKVHELLDGI